MTLATTSPPAEALSRLVDRHGARAILAALIAELASRTRARRNAPSRARLDATALSQHLRRDIGLPPRAPAPQHWTIR